MWYYNFMIFSRVDPRLRWKHVARLTYTNWVVFTNFTTSDWVAAVVNSSRVKKRRRLTSCCAAARSLRQVDDRRHRYPLGEALWFSHFFIFQRSVSFFISFLSCSLSTTITSHIHLLHIILNCSFLEKWAMWHGISLYISRITTTTTTATMLLLHCRPKLFVAKLNWSVAPRRAVFLFVVLRHSL
jgi:hypothetical protein